MPINNKPQTPNHPVFRGGKFAILTGEKPKYEVTPGYEGENSSLVNHLEKMKQEGHISHYQPVVGKYGELENSFIVHNPNFEKMKDLGYHFGQESVILSNKGKHQLVYTNGQHYGMAHPHVPTQDDANTSSNVVQHTQEPEDYYTKGKDLQQKQMMFTIPIDFDSKNPVKGAPMKKSAMDYGFNFSTSQFVPSHSDSAINVVRRFGCRTGK